MTENPFLSQTATAAQTQAQAQAPAQAPAFQPTQAQAPAPMATPSQPAGDPFATPSGSGDGSRIADDLGSALLVRPLEYRENVTTTNGATDAIVADWVVLDGPNAGQLRESSLVFQAALRGNLKRVLDGPSSFLVGRLARGEAKGNKSAPYLFQEDPSVMDTARQAAAHYRWV